MPSFSLSTNPGLLQASRLQGLTYRGDRATSLEMATLAACGACAALLTAFLDLNLRIPGHAILRVVLPLTLGLALVPRRGAGTAMTASSLLTLTVLAFLGLARGGSGALTSLALAGPSLDLASRRVRPGLGLHTRFALAGLATNVAAFAVRASSKALGWEHVGKRQLAEWWPEAMLTYAACGLAVGLVSALLWFHFSAGRSGPQEGPDA